MNAQLKSEVNEKLWTGILNQGPALASAEPRGLAQPPCIWATRRFRAFILHLPRRRVRVVRRQSVAAQRLLIRADIPVQVLDPTTFPPHNHCLPGHPLFVELLLYIMILQTGCGIQAHFRVQIPKLPPWPQ